jgi:hypothetical protein
MKALGHEVRKHVAIGALANNSSGKEGHKNDTERRPEQAFTHPLMAAACHSSIFPFEFMAFFPPRILPPNPDQQGGRKHRVQEHHDGIHWVH